jgi:hypothetical protein
MLDAAFVDIFCTCIYFSIPCRNRACPFNIHDNVCIQNFLYHRHDHQGSFRDGRFYIGIMLGAFHFDRRLCDTDRMIADPFQIRTGFHHRYDFAQVSGDRLLQGYQFETFELQVVLQCIDGCIFIYDLLR